MRRETRSARGSQASTSLAQGRLGEEGVEIVSGAERQGPQQLGGGEEGGAVRAVSSRETSQDGPLQKGASTLTSGCFRRSGRRARTPGLLGQRRWERFWNGMPARPRASISGGAWASVR